MFSIATFACQICRKLLAGRNKSYTFLMSSLIQSRVRELRKPVLFDRQLWEKHPFTNSPPTADIANQAPIC